jgi:3-oxoacyl-[acyl-carrier protein] reductase
MVELVNELAGKVAIVTGSARNIGRVTAEELARAGAAVVINAVQAKDLCEEVAEGIRAKGGRAIPVIADCRKPDDIERLAQAAIKEFGGIDILVHNAATRNPKSFDDLTREDFMQVIDLSILGCFHLAKATVPSMRQRGGGAIIGVGGLNSYTGQKGRSHLMVAKAGLNMYIRGLALDLAADNITANQVVVGTYNTRDPDDKMTAEQIKARESRIPMGREGLPQDMADLIRFLVGPGGHYITGQTIHSNGGAFMNS